MVILIEIVVIVVFLVVSVFLSVFEQYVFFVSIAFIKFFLFLKGELLSEVVSSCLSQRHNPRLLLTSLPHTDLTNISRVYYLSSPLVSRYV